MGRLCYAGWAVPLKPPPGFGEALVGLSRRAAELRTLADTTTMPGASAIGFGEASAGGSERVVGRSSVTGSEFYVRRDARASSFW